MNTLKAGQIHKPRSDERPVWDSIFGNIGYAAVLVAHDGAAWLPEALCYYQPR